MKLTKQGVRDLDSIGPKTPKRQISDEMPDKIWCAHEFVPARRKGDSPVCKKCGEEKALCW